MAMFYSQSTGGFYLPGVHGDKTPLDAVEISDADHASLIRGQSYGKRISAGSDGRPTLTDPPAPSHADVVAQALSETRAERQHIIGILDGLQASALAKGEASDASDIETAKQALRDITKTDMSDCATYVDMQQKIKLAYLSIVASSSPSVVLAFREVVA